MLHNGQNGNVWPQSMIGSYGLFFNCEASIIFDTQKGVHKLDARNVLFLFFAFKRVCIEFCVLVFLGSLAKPGLKHSAYTTSPHFICFFFFFFLLFLKKIYNLIYRFYKRKTGGCYLRLPRILFKNLYEYVNTFAKHI